MFLSRDMTVFIPHRLAYEHKEEIGWEDTLARTDWTVSHDFVRDLFRHRELIEQSALILLPTDCSYTSTYDSTPDERVVGSTHENLEILQALDKGQRNRHGD